MGSFGSFCVIHGFQEALLQPGGNIGSKCGQVLDLISYYFSFPIYASL